MTRQLVQQTRQQVAEPLAAAIIELIEITLVYKVPQMSRQEIEAMPGFVDDFKQTRVYQEVRQAGRQAGERSLQCHYLEYSRVKDWWIKRSPDLWQLSSDRGDPVR